MQSDMHFYGTYAMARAAGIAPEQARIIATSAQFVDDSTDGKRLDAGRHGMYFPVVTGHALLDPKNTIMSDQLRVWLPFHFLPGDLDSPSAERRLTCTKGSRAAKAILEFALDKKDKPYGLYLAGVVSHVFEDTYSHYGFVGLSSRFNGVNIASVQVTPPEEKGLFDYLKDTYEAAIHKFHPLGPSYSILGHATVGEYPDRPYLAWRYEDSEGELVARNNPKDYLECCQALHAFFQEFPGRGQARSWADIREAVAQVIAFEGRKAARELAWKDCFGQLVSGGALPADTSLTYNAWSLSDIEKAVQAGQLETCPLHLFMQAADAYRNHVLEEYLPDRRILLS